MRRKSPSRMSIHSRGLRLQGAVRSHDKTIHLFPLCSEEAAPRGSLGDSLVVPERPGFHGYWRFRRRTRRCEPSHSNSLGRHYENEIQFHLDWIRGVSFLNILYATVSHVDLNEEGGVFAQKRRQLAVLAGL
jgi:hypothetical protein